MFLMLREVSERTTKTVRHKRQHWQYIDELATEATSYWDRLPPDRRDFDRAKDQFMTAFI